VLAEGQVHIYRYQLFSSIGSESVNGVDWRM